MEYFAYAANWLQATAGLLILGTLVVSLLVVEGGSETIDAWRQRTLDIATYLAIILLTAGLFLPSFQAISIEQRSTAAFDLNTLKLVLFSTRFGTVWLIQECFSFLILLSLILRNILIPRIGYKRFLTLVGTITTLMLLSGSFKSHAASLEPMWPGLLGNGLHVIAAGSWLGALPALILLLRSPLKQNTDSTDHAIIERTLRRFSVLATMMVATILFSGTIIGYLQVSRWGELFSTPYGHYLLVKILLFLMMIAVAGIIRLRYMPLYNSKKPSSLINIAISKWIALETTFGLILLAVANVLKNTTPAAHEEVIIWPFDFRFSIEATWEELPEVRIPILLGLCLITLAIVLTIHLVHKRNNKQMAIISGSVLSIIGLAVCLPQLSVEAYPDTYRNSTVPYVAVSIKNGEDLFLENCTTCHGIKGKGDGVLAKTLSIEPANLTEPHTALHTAGDMYWWLTHGLGDEGAMPPFNEVFDEDEMWDIINFLRAFSEGYSGRVLLTTIVPEGPFLGAPDFYYSTATSSGNLKDFRKDKAILLVFFSWPETKDRLDRLKDNYKKITRNNADVIAIAINGEEGMQKKVLEQYPFTIITEETESIVQTFLLFRRSLQNRGEFDDKSLLKHIEFTVDRFGYFRSRLVPEENPGAWDDLTFLAQQFSELAEEDEILPPPDEHIH